MTEHWLKKFHKEFADKTRGQKEDIPMVILTKEQYINLHKVLPHVKAFTKEEENFDYVIISMDKERTLITQWFKENENPSSILGDINRKKLRKKRVMSND
jgi:hypothetical protein